MKPAVIILLSIFAPLATAQTDEACLSSEYQTLAERFNRELAGGYPFGELDSRDADPVAVKEFFAEYENRRSELRRRLLPLQGSKCAAPRRFIKAKVPESICFCPG